MVRKGRHNRNNVDYMTESEGTDVFESPARERKMRSISNVSYSDTDSEDQYNAVSKVRVSRNTILQKGNVINTSNGMGSNMEVYEEVDNNSSIHHQSVQGEEVLSSSNGLLDMSDILSVSALF